MTAENVTNYQTLFQTVVAEGFRTAVPHAFLSMFLQMDPIVDLGIETATIESWLNEDEVAPLVSFLTPARDENGKVMTPGVSGANEYLFGCSEAAYNVSSGNLRKRIPNEDYVLTSKNDDDVREQRAAYWTSKLGMENFKKVLRRLELMAQESFLTGEMTIADKWQTEGKLIFPRAATLKNRTVEAVWTNASTAKPWNDYGDAQEEIIKQGGAVGIVDWFSVMSSSSYKNLKAIYREQAKGVDTGYQAVVKDTELSRDKDNMPSGLQFLLDGGMQYGGMVRSDFSSDYIHIFTYPVYYTNDSDVKTPFFSGDVVPLCAYSPEIFSAYFGSGRHWDPTGDGLDMIGLGDLPQGEDTNGLTVGNLGLPANAIHHTICPTPDKTGLNGFVEMAPIFANRVCNMVATIDTLTAT